jgi:hypothetical protein
MSGTGVVEFGYALFGAVPLSQSGCALPRQAILEFDQVNEIPPVPVEITILAGLFPGEIARF